MGGKSSSKEGRHPVEIAVGPAELEWVFEKKRMDRRLLAINITLFSLAVASFVLYSLTKELTEEEIDNNVRYRFYLSKDLLLALGILFGAAFLLSMLDLFK